MKYKKILKHTRTLRYNNNHYIYICQGTRKQDINTNYTITTVYGYHDNNNKNNNNFSITITGMFMRTLIDCPVLTVENCLHQNDLYLGIKRRNIAGPWRYLAVLTVGRTSLENQI